MDKMPKVGQIFEHYKRGIHYIIENISEDVDTLDVVITYKQIKKDPTDENEEIDLRTWSRSKKKFMEDVEIDGKMIPQYRRIS